MLEELKKRVCQANLDLLARGLVIDTWGNASGVDRTGGAVVIKPSGLAYEQMKPRHMTVVALSDGSIVEGDLRPSSDTPTHLAIYRAFPAVGGIVHTHSLHATAWAQARKEIPPLGTTHAHYFRGPVPLTRALTAEEIAENYESNVGKVIVERLAGLDPADFPAVLVCAHGPFVWGADPQEAVHNAVILEHLARLASETLRVEPYPRPIGRHLLEKHFSRKHAPGKHHGRPADTGRRDPPTR